jgi:dTDP-4-dehydrorhamnose reductase
MLVLGHRGKLGLALVRAFGQRFQVEGRSLSQGFDAGDFSQVRQLLEAVRPQVVANAVACTGLDACEADSAKAFQLNAHLPRYLARCSRELGFLLLHFSSDAVFDGTREAGFYSEDDPPAPVNVYGASKLEGDVWAAAETERHYVFRLSVLAGECQGPGQFLEKMIARARSGQTLQVSNDIFCSPSYVRDVAEAVRAAVDSGLPFGLYHTANTGCASLWELVDAAVRELGLEAPVLPVSHETFPSRARKALYTPLTSVKQAPLRPWREAIRDYCRREGWSQVL